MINEEEVMELANQYYHESKIRKLQNDRVEIQSDQVKTLCKALVEVINKEFYRKSDVLITQATRI
jgi:hypothetical protein